MNDAATVPLVSVGCAVYNGAETLRRALDSVVGQDYPNLEIIICDDGSTDGSRALCLEYAARYSNIRYFENEKNLGVVGNFNKLFGLATGKYFFWADQDDVRGLTFVSQCASVLEADESAVLCHCHTGVFWKEFENLVHVNTIDHVDNEADLLKRYWRFLRTYSDTTIYGLIRADALRRTALWRDAPGSSVSLLFELLIQGKFRQVPATLYFYSAKGPSRPGPEDEHLRSSGARRVPAFRRPFVAVARNQTRGILAAPGSLRAKWRLLLVLWSHIAVVNGSKAAFRVIEALIGDRVPRWFARACAFAIVDTRDIHYVAPPEVCREYAPDEQLTLLRARRS